jgi:hypothetical protein
LKVYVREEGIYGNIYRKPEGASWWSRDGHNDKASRHTDSRVSTSILSDFPNASEFVCMDWALSPHDRSTRGGIISLHGAESKRGRSFAVTRLLHRETRRMLGFGQWFRAIMVL